MDIHYAIGDMHGRDDLLERIHARIAFQHQCRYGDCPAVLVHIGDYIDGRSQSIQVIDRVMRGLDGFKSVSLLGNHEALMLACLETDDRQVWMNWLYNGGDETLKSLGISFRFGGYEPDTLCDALGEERIAWLRSLPLYYLTEEYLFVHAGIVPGVPLEEQKSKDLLWIRSRFLESDLDHGFVVVHGHTPADGPELKPNRIGIDTGATSRGMLTAVELCPDAEPSFIQVSGCPGIGI